jgi:hypothetical protein
VLNPAQKQVVNGHPVSNPEGVLSKGLSALEGVLDAERATAGGLLGDDKMLKA